MDAMLVLRTAAWLFVLTALGGITMAGIRFVGQRNPPVWLSMGHGFAAGAGVTLLAYAVFTTAVPATAKAALALFLLAAGGGVLMTLAFEWKHRLLPAWLVLAHALVAVAGFVLLLFAAFR